MVLVSYDIVSYEDHVYLAFSLPHRPPQARLVRMFLVWVFFFLFPKSTSPSRLLGSPAVTLVWAVTAYLVPCSPLHPTCILECSLELVCAYLWSAMSPCAGPQTHTFPLRRVPLSHTTAWERWSQHAHLSPALPCQWRCPTPSHE